MKVADGGYRPAYNVQLATDTATQIISGVDLSHSGGDQGKLAPMVEQHVERYKEPPKEMLVDGGSTKKDDITAVSPAQGGTTVYAPVQKSKKEEIDPHMPRNDDSPAVLSGGCAWPPTKPMRFTRGAPPRPSVSTLSRATGTCIKCVCGVRRKCGPLSGGTCWPIT